MTGSSGFIGSAVLSGLLRARTGGRIAELRLLGRTPPDRHTLSRPGLVWQHADLAEPRSLAGTLDGTDVLLHLAARTSGTVDECETVNTRACEVLAAEARRVGLGRIVHLSTAAVYGAGPHSGTAVDEIPPAPVSAASATRPVSSWGRVTAGWSRPWTS
ncbi:NAD(P)-dependent oxidoreductase [Streptomyces sp. E5N91]|uniref:NAD-dependent epimerase/dehydratase family protein n=1 Tax=Streptomyces sp. E5N91 TaxID=1851996 RepID=UPI001EE97BF2|nr:NAD(P)-dependent oxidoreductase [Streptomyces sp. E5N91]